MIGQNGYGTSDRYNNHVVEGNDTLTVSFIDEESVEANVKGTNAAKDLAVVAVKLSDIKDSTMDAIAVATLGDSTQIQLESRPSLSEMPWATGSLLQPASSQQPTGN